MLDVEKVADDVYFIKQPTRPGWLFGVTVVLGIENIGVVDTGFENTPGDHIFPFIEEQGRKPEEINYIVNTHRDGDHVLGNSVIKERTKAKIAIHELEAEAVETADIMLKDGDIIEIGDREFNVIHTPGHRPGSICLYDKVNRTLITGDSVCGDREDLIRMDKNIYINSLKKLLDLDLEVMVMSHPFRPLGKSILRGNEIKEMIRASIGIAEKL
jgi:glyoxylase-like metal-dependent hydrolase (beta-lactamase superfamily II)